MEIYSSNFSSQLSNKGNGIPTKAGDISSIVVKERTGGNEAKVIFKGQEVSVKFEGPVPSADRVLVEVKGQTPDGKITLKMISSADKGNQNAIDLLRKAGFDLGLYPELKEAIKQILSKGGKLSKESLTHLQEFLRTETGTLSEKLETIKFVQQRGLEFTKTTLQSIHAAFNDSELILNLLSDIDHEQSQENVKPSDSKFLAADSKPIGTPILAEAVTPFDGKALSTMEEAILPLPLSSQNVLVTKVSEKLSQLTLDFSNVRKELGWSLDTAAKLIEVKNLPNAKQNLEATITKLDKTILKGDFMLYADMSMEKELLSASTKLAEARKLVSRGDFVQAGQIVKEVKGRIDQLTFKPSEQKVLHYTAEQQPKTAIELFAKTILETKQGSRFIFEMVKAMGLTHEADAAEALSEKRDVPANLKSFLLQLQESGNEQPKAAQALASITGQQLLSRQDTSGAQNLFLQLPILLNKQVENVQVLVNSKKNGEKIDWENCDLYFVLETKKLGEMGISLSTTNRNLSITFKSDQEALKEIVQPLTDEVRESLQEIGYNVGAIQYKRFTLDTDMVKIEKPTSVKRKGFDLTI
ncbi:hypothetical protein ACF5W4_16700 [Bacillota bacterium Lsc_1132]